MFLVGLFRLLRRRWYVAVVAAAMVAAAAGYVMTSDGVYTARAAVVMLAPVTDSSPNSLSSGTESLVHFAAIIERQYQGDAGSSRFASDNATLYGAGVLEGTRVWLPTEGGQWATNFNQPQLLVEVVGGSVLAAQDALARALGDIEKLVTSIQDGADVPADARITTLVSPASAEVSYVGHNRTRALAALVLLGAFLTVVGSLAVDRFALRRQNRRASAGQLSP